MNKLYKHIIVNFKILVGIKIKHNIKLSTIIFKLLYSNIYGEFYETIRWY